MDSHSKISTSNNVELLNFEASSEVLNKTSCVFFIPTKIRVYSTLVNSPINDEITTPAPGYVKLVEKYKGTDVQVIDLTNSLVDAAKKELNEKKLVFWRDDTHWGPDGIKAVLNDIMRCVKH